MKSRWTTYLLIAAVAIIWGFVAWEIFAPAKNHITSMPSMPVKRQRDPVVVVDTLFLNYPDPFLKVIAEKRGTSRSAAQNIPAVQKKSRREIFCAVHLGSISAAGSQLHILKINDAQYELHLGDKAAGFRLCGLDADSLYLDKDSMCYGVKRCEE